MSPKWAKKAHFGDKNRVSEYSYMARKTASFTSTTSQGRVCQLTINIILCNTKTWQMGFCKY